MDGFASDISLYLLATLVVGAAVGWLTRSTLSKNVLNDLRDDWQARYDEVVNKRDRLSGEATTLRTTVEAQEAVVHQRDLAVRKIRTNFESALEKEKLLVKNVFTLRAEREDFKTKVAMFQNALASLKRQSMELQSEFIKSGDFYKSELAKSFAIRKTLQEKLENSKKEHQSFTNLLQASRSEHFSVNKMLTSAQTRLTNLDAIEQRVIGLEAENAQIKHDSARTQQENDAFKRDVSEQKELKVQNKELAQVLKSVENSRKQYEDDANRYREHAGKSEQKSETLRLRLDEVEKNFLEMEKQQHKALKDARSEAASHASSDHDAAEQEVDNLKEIVGIGKVFEHTLHELGVTSFRQLANFGVADVSRVNAELKEFRGRMEQDDWIGQARELHFKKYG